MGFASRKLGLLLLAVGITGGCNGDSTGPEPSGGHDPVIMSGVIDLGPQNPSVNTVVYISLAEGTAPRGSTAQAINLATRNPIAGFLKNGGLDPIVVPAEVGDSIRIIVHDSGGGQREFIREAKKRKPPVVVRADPPDNKTDVVLNRVRIIVVFSQPMDTASVTSETVRLLQAGQPVAGATILSADQTYLVITPATPLLPETAYTIFVTTGVMAADGGPLLQPFTSSFTTGAGDEAATVTIDPHPDTVEAGVPVTLTASARDQSDSVLSGMTVSWSSANPSVASVDDAGTVRALAPGAARIIASVDGVSDSATIVFSPLSFVSISAGGSHSCGVSTSGRAFCWGSNTRWQLGNGENTLPSSLPRAVAGGIAFASLSAGDSATCGDDTNGQGYCWGGDSRWDYNQGNFGALVPSPVPSTAVPPTVPLQKITTGLDHGCGLAGSGTAYCWGRFEGSAFTLFGGPRPIVTTSVFTSLSSGGGHDCGITASGALECWGWNDVGQLGDGTESGSNDWWHSQADFSLKTTVVQSGVQFARVSAGRDHTCALSTSGQAYCWGSNVLGQLGGIAATQCYEAQTLDLPSMYPDMVVPCALVPSAVSGNLTFTDISAGMGFTCGIASDGTAYCWGRNEANQLGNATGIGSNTPVAVGGGLLFQSIDAGGDHACGRTTTGIVYCWGANDVGQLGNGNGVNFGIPVKVSFQP